MPYVFCILCALMAGMGGARLLGSPGVLCPGTFSSGAFCCSCELSPRAHSKSRIQPNPGRGLSHLSGFLCPVPSFLIFLLTGPTHFSLLKLSFWLG